MNRRQFLSTSVAALLVPFVPAIAVEPKLYDEVFVDPDLLDTWGIHPVVRTIQEAIDLVRSDGKIHLASGSKYIFQTINHRGKKFTYCPGDDVIFWGNKIFNAHPECGLRFYLLDRENVSINHTTVISQPPPDGWRIGDRPWWVAC